LHLDDNLLPQTQKRGIIRGHLQAGDSAAGKPFKGPRRASARRLLLLSVFCSLCGAMRGHETFIGMFWTALQPTLSR
jgi:hypothetical protein